MARATYSEREDASGRSARPLAGAAPPFVEAQLGYSAEIARACTDLVEPHRTHMPQVFRQMRIHDARPIRDSLDLDREGFTLVHHSSTAAHATTSPGFDQDYHAELAPIVLAHSGADFVLPARKYLALRQPAVGDHATDYIKAPSNLVHMDFTQGSFARIVRMVMEEEGAATRDYSRVALYQLWRPLTPPPADFPFALADATSVSVGDHIVMDNIIGPRDAPGNVLQTRLGIYSPAHRWFTFPNMTPDELVLFKGNDTRFGDSQSVLHAAFDNRPNEPHAVPRHSVEARMLAFWN